MKNVIIFCDYFGNGGIEKVSLKMKEILSSTYNVSILTTIFNSNLLVDCKIISKFKTLNPIYRFFVTLFNIKKYTKNADIVHINMHSSINLLYACMISKKKTVFVHAHNSEFKNNKFMIKTFFNFVFKMLFLRKRFKYISCSKKASDFCFGKKVNSKIIYNNYDGNKYIFNNIIRKKMRGKYHLDDDCIVLGHVGRFSIQKNHKFLIDIFSNFLLLHENSFLFMIGNGEEQNNIKDLVKKYNIEDKVVFIDFTSRVNDYYQMFDAFVFPSKFEGYGIVVYEALCSSLRCFVSDEISDNFNHSNLFSLSLKQNASIWANNIFLNIKYKRKKLLFNDNFKVNLENCYSIISEKISIILPVYNSNKTINKCIDSILNQSYSNFELIIIDDGSTDNTNYLIKKYKDKRIKLFYQENSGTGSARNLGILKSKGNYITFIDSDDEIKSNYLDELLYNLLYYDADISCCSAKNKTSNNIFILNKKEAFNELIKLPESISMSVTRKMFKKELFNNLFFDINNHFEDIDFAIRSFLKANKVVFVDKYLYIYNNYQNSRSKYYKGNDRIRGCLSSRNLIKNNYHYLYNKYIVYVMFNSIGVANNMIINNTYDDKILVEIHELIKDNFKYIFVSGYPLSKIIQLLIFYFNFKFYKVLYTLFRR